MWWSASCVGFCFTVTKKNSHTHCRWSELRSCSNLWLRKFRTKDSSDRITSRQSAAAPVRHFSDTDAALFNSAVFNILCCVNGTFGACIVIRCKFNLKNIFFMGSAVSTHVIITSVTCLSVIYSLNVEN